MSKPMIGTYNLETGTEEIREMNADEIEEMEAFNALAD
jgi:hypothetical protein